ncbi:uncharacterized protein LAESUDRAFT_653023 [Laetiporus sulphureus 93-53]|uniref:Integrase core domain-containing protein n=1 Tax=Laetiporus sulphureus 93-53 TaxID=1314785 RepID=A0A165EC05_9APHY|nr:uncharacterized protein LAESUDRAFT_653023 [Laetiporus sulphureus 93-53]KZT06697.1 hypothetical protein LAESUDRAFT_653023 [Laetiporus sulphureus 93-53]
MRIYGLQNAFSPISNGQLNAVVKAYKQRKPDSGICYLRGFLHQHHLQIQKNCLYQSLRHVDGLNHVLQWRRTIQRRKYKSSRLNALWHCDGHHKLIHWGIVIHGFIDGFCHTTWLASVIFL